MLRPTGGLGAIASGRRGWLLRASQCVGQLPAGTDPELAEDIAEMQPPCTQLAYVATSGLILGDNVGDRGGADECREGVGDLPVRPSLKRSTTSLTLLMSSSITFPLCVCRT